MNYVRLWSICERENRFIRAADIECAIVVIGLYPLQQVALVWL